MHNTPSGLKPAKSLRAGHIGNSANGNKYVVKGTTQRTKHWERAKPADIKCASYLKRSIKKLTHEARHGLSKRIRTIPQAVAVSYSKTQARYPKCQLLNRQKPKTVPNTEAKCERYLQRSIKKLTHEAKHGLSTRIRTIPQAVAVSYSKTRAKFPSCRAVSNRKSGSTKKVVKKQLNKNVIF
jgi:hypothetical protein